MALPQKASLAATNTTLYTVPPGTTATVNVSMTNTGAGAVSVRLAIASSSTPSASEWIEYDVSIPGNGVLERTGMVIGASENVVAYAASTGIVVRVYGYEEAV